MTTTPERLRDEGIAHREHHADPRLILAVDKVIARWAKSGREFSANDLRRQVPTAAQDLVAGRIRSAWMRRPALIVRVGVVPSSLDSTHNKPVNVWRGAAFGDAS